MYTQDSLEKLRQHIDIVDVLGEYVQLKKTGSTYKGLCPFHNEKTPSFIVNRSAGSYHCFGCHAHGDTISFIINFLNYSFVDAINFLSKRYNLELEKSNNQSSEIENNKYALRQVCFIAQEFFRFCLFRLDEGHNAINYLYKRGITIDSIHRFKLGYAPKKHFFIESMKELNIDENSLIKSGFFSSSNFYFLFEDRITFPIHDALNNTIGFSARQMSSKLFGGKYVNSFDSLLFKKSSVFFGLNFCRQRIAKEKTVILVEGQLDCLQMIDHGFNLTLATLGTAFGEGHIQQLIKLGVRRVFLLFDGDDAGKNAALKVGNLIQSNGIEVKVCLLPKRQDPDSFLIYKGSSELINLLEKSEDYLSFLVTSLSLKHDLKSPAEKSELIGSVITQINEWKDPILVYETLKKFSSLVKIPEELLISKVMLSVPQPVLINQNTFTNTNNKNNFKLIDVNLILETDILRWLIFCYQRKEVMMTMFHYVKEEHFFIDDCKKLFIACKENYNNNKNTIDLLKASSLVSNIHVIELIANKKINLDMTNQDFIESIQKILDRNWFKAKEKISTLICNQQNSEEVWDLVKKFDELQNKRILVKIVN